MMSAMSIASSRRTSGDGAEDALSPNAIINFEVSSVPNGHTHQHAHIHREELSSPSPTSDVDHEEYSKLRCSSVQTEVISERRRRTSSGYPGLAFGSSIFSSNTIMKFRVISNELHNIQNVQLKRAEGEVAALNKRIQRLGESLEKSEESLKFASRELDDMSLAFNRQDDEKESIEYHQQLIQKYFTIFPEVQSESSNVL